MIYAKAEGSKQVLSAFEPIGAKAAAQLMILGSMPGAVSLAETEYYAHPRNAFWPIMQAIFGGSIATYADKCGILTTNNLVVWDVLSQCIRPGSLDANIRKDSVVCNDFAAFLDIQPTVSCIAFNGKASEQLFRKQVMSDLNVHFIDASDNRQSESTTALGTAERTIQLVSLPSTSPAMAALSLDDKIVAWRNALLQVSEYHQIKHNQV